MARLELKQELMTRPGVSLSFWPWFLQRVSALGLLVLLPAHIVATHLFNIAEVEEGALPGLVVFSDVTQRLEQPVYWMIDLLLLGFVLFHGLNGVRNVLLDYGVRGAGERVATGALSLLGIAAFAYGVVVLASFIN